MAAWHTRLWRRIRLAPGVTVNLSKSGPSVSVGPRGSKVTFSRRGARQTVGIPGTGLYATRQSPYPDRAAAPTAPPAATVAGPPATTPTPSAREPGSVAGAPAPAAAPPLADEQLELYYGFAALVGIGFGIVLLLLGVPVGQAAVATVLAIAGGIAYEGLAHHHPGPAKALAEVAVGLAALAAAVLGVIAVVAVGALLVGGGSSGRRWRR